MTKHYAKKQACVCVCVCDYVMDYVSIHVCALNMSQYLN